ncbi:MAG: response regulator [Bacteroidia bacterium]
MSTKKAQSLPYSPQPKAGPRFERVVVIDGNTLDLFINETILRAAAIAKTVTVASKAQHILSELQNAERLSEVPELIFFDLEMEGMTGFDFLDQFSKLSDFIRNKCKLVVITGSSSADDRQRALSNPSVVRYLRKPLDVFQLKEFLYN